LDEIEEKADLDNCNKAWLKVSSAVVLKGSDLEEKQKKVHTVLLL